LELKLSKGRALALATLINEREELGADIEELMTTYGASGGLSDDFRLEQRPDGLWLVGNKKKDEEEKAGTE